MALSQLILASASPRRQALLKYLVANFDTQSADIDENVNHDDTPLSLVRRLSLQKAVTVLRLNPEATVIGSDTVIAINNEILGKPKDKIDFLGMMKRLSASQHQVYTGVCVLNKHTQCCEVVCTDVDFDHLDENDMMQYWSTGEPSDKAGGYAIQGIGGQFVKRINGSVSAVIGLPLAETKALLKKLGVINVG